jgi:hypothetical protein
MTLTAETTHQTAEAGVHARKAQGSSRGVTGAMRTLNGRA